MTLYIAETGRPPGGLDAAHGTYPEMFRAMLARVGYTPEVVPVALLDGEKLSAAPAPGDGLIITGSPAGAYEDHAWIAPLEAAIRGWVAADAPIVGICFGHQVMAQALGGKVEKSVRGWGVGVHTYEVLGELPFAGPSQRFACAVSHQDQVTALPEGAVRFAGSAFCPNGAIAYGERAISFQMHPEFEHPFAAELLALREDRIPPDVVAYGRASLANGSDRHAMGAWIANILSGDAK